MNRKLYVGNLSFKTEEQTLEQLFSEAGPVASARVVRDKATGQSRGFGFVEMDSDLSHDPEALPSLIGAVHPVVAGEGGTAGPPTGPQLAIGSRYVPGGSIPNWRWHRRMLSRWGNRYSALGLGFRVRDATSGYPACQRFGGCPNTGSAAVMPR